VAQKLLDLLQGHPALKKRGGHRMAQEMGLHPLGDLGLSGLFDDLLDAPGGV
jgi:hypothetical protein